MTLSPSRGRARPRARPQRREGSMGILRARMEHDLIVRGRSERTRESYLHAVAALARYYRRPPDQLTDREVQQYLRYLIEQRQLAWSSCRVAVAGLRFFYEITPRRPPGEVTRPLPPRAPPP